MAYDDESIMPFGKHKGKKLSEVPGSYLIWLEGQLKRGDWLDLQMYIRENMDALKKETSTESRE